MALDWRDTGGSQFFITHSPAPHLDARYTVFGTVVAGMDVVDRLLPWDVIRRVRIRDGSESRVEPGRLRSSRPSLAGPPEGGSTATR